MKNEVLQSVVPDVTPGISVNSKGHLVYAGIDTLELVKKYGSPLFVMNEDRIRENCRFIRKISAAAFGASSKTAYASKAFSCRQIYRIMKDEGMCADVVSGGELYTALTAGFDAADIFFHGNNKTGDDIEFAIKSKVGIIVADNLTELELISRTARIYGTSQDIILRVSPGIDPHTHEKISTGKIDSKFGVPIGNGQAAEAVSFALGLPGINLLGFHYHIGSQITDSDPFICAIENALSFIRDMRDKFGLSTKMLNIGGGFGIRYTADAPRTDYDGIFSSVSKMLVGYCAKNRLEVPVIVTEPGRSIVADAGITLYTIGSVKTIPGYKSYVSIDGGMTDNPRFTLYGSRYTALIANKADRPAEFRTTVAGRCCESGDLIGVDMPIQDPAPGDILAVLNTGAYNYSMSSNYNRLPRLPVIMIKDGKDYVAVRRESYEDLVRLDN